MKLFRYLMAILISVFLISVSYAATTWESGKRYQYKCTGGLTGGGTSALDAISGASIGEYDTAIVYDISGSTIYRYKAEVAGVTGTENSPYIIEPDGVLAGGTAPTGTTRWELLDSYVSRFECFELKIQGTLWDNGSGGMAQSVVRASVTSSVFDKSTDEIEQILSGTSDQIIAYDASGVAKAIDPSSTREALGVEIGTDVQAYDATNVVDGDFSVNGIMIRTGAGAYASGDTNNAKPTGAWDFSTGTSVSANTPTDNSHVATKKYVDDNAGGGGGGSGTTTFDTDSGSAVAAFRGEATRMGIAGKEGIETSASGETVYISGIWKQKATGVTWLEDSGGATVFAMDSTGFSWWASGSGLTIMFVDLSGATAIDLGIQSNNPAASGKLHMFEGTANGTNFVGIQAPSSLTGNYMLTLPLVAGVSDQVLAVDGSGNLTFSEAVSQATLNAHGAPSTTTGTSIQALAVTESKIDWSSGTSIASAVTKFKSFTVSDCQDIGGGSGNSPFALFPVPTSIYPNGVFLVYLGLSAQHGSSIGIDGNFSEWSSGSCAFNIGTLRVTSNTGLAEHNLISGSTCVIEAGNEVFFHLENTSGVSIISGSIGFMPR
ncbi:MAG: hypothetical protein SWO11_21815 [Thermodesulfobacteriota bacterium]|nr:hypothetical protein [Thermodesulfobacteriota bacterium]